MHWGLLGPEKLSSLRRTRTLGLGAAVRTFNELAAPGMGGVWFGKQLFLALLGIALAEEARKQRQNVSNIETANAVEALACWLAFKGNGWQRDSRLRGRLKLQGKEDLSFSIMRKRNFYVTQPMRMSTVEPLLALGFVESEGERFNAMNCSDAGRKFLDAASKDFKPRKRTVFDHLSRWVCSDESNVDTPELRRTLSPLDPLPEEARDILRERIVVSGEGAARRKAALAWVSKEPASDWGIRPDSISDDHWRDLRVGARFFLTRDAALAALDAVEIHIGDNSPFDPGAGIPEGIDRKLVELRERAHAFLEEVHDRLDDVACRFCRECIEEPAKVLLSLVRRDERVLRLRDGKIVPGLARDSRGPTGATNDQMEEDDETEGNDSGVFNSIRWPAGISFRINNLYLMARDLEGELGEQLRGNSNG